ncbi:hypothetical protein [Streptomyces clavuligerus]|uniref:hypothetical protein n=1 Tax=Streptomyces clavuligerus TaxID=1901 RepID=UPI001E31A8D3|nr:hypothetical protein [Streptomyces clavuligerus]
MIGRGNGPPMSPHTNDRAQRKALTAHLYIDQRTIERISCGRPSLDNAGPQQQDFQAMLATCLMSTYENRHPFEPPSGGALSSAESYFNTIVSRPGQFDVHTNTACRIAARLLPLLHDGHRVSGIPGLRLESHNKRRLRLIHLPTGGRLDLIDSRASTGRTRRDFRRRLNMETDWHTDPGIAPLWTSKILLPKETALAHHWARRSCTPLRSALMTRAMLIWYKLGIKPTWHEPSARRDYPVLLWAPGNEQVDAARLGRMLTQSPALIPGAVYKRHNASNGLLILGTESVVRLRSLTD